MDQAVAAICNDHSRIAVCVFNGSKYILHPVFYDDFSLSRSVKILDAYMCPLVASLSEIFQEAFKAQHRDGVTYMHSTSRSSTFKCVGKLENTAIRLLATHMSHLPLVHVESDSIVGYAGEYAIEKGVSDAFFIDEYVISNIKAFSRLNTLKKNTVTSFGRQCMLRWIMEPLTSEDAISGRRTVLDQMASKIPKIQKLLKKCRVNCFNKELDLFRLRRLMKSALTIHKLLRGVVRLQHGGRYLRLYRILRIFGRDGIVPGKDSRLDELWKIVGRVPSILEAVAKRLAGKYQVPLSCVYIPGGGFFVECTEAIHPPAFRIKDKLYIKCDEMTDLDGKFGDPYEQINAREIRISSKVIHKIRKMRLSYLYDFIGAVDSHVSLYLSAEGKFSAISTELDTFTCTGTRFDRRSIFLGEFNMNALIETVVLNQIGAQVEGSRGILPLFVRLIFKPRNKDEEGSSTFQNEIIHLSSLYRYSNEGTLVILEGVAESTAPAQGVRIFGEICGKIAARFLVVSTSYDYSDLKGIQSLEGMSFFHIRDGVQEVVESDIDVEYELCNEFIQYIQMVCKRTGGGYEFNKC